jgi:hypothetical protein
MTGNASKSKTIASKSIVKTTTTLFDVNHRRRHIAQNLLIWVDSTIDASKQDYQNTLVQLRSVVNDVNTFTQTDESIDFLTEVDDIKAFLIVEGTIGRHIVPLIHEISQLDAIYIFCNNPSPHEQWTKEWVKVKGVHTNIESICQAIELAVKQCNQDSIPVSFVAVSEEASNETLNQLEPSFMYTQIFKEILLEMDHDEKSIRDLVNYCRELYHDNMKELNIINDFEHNYRSKSPIWWYTRECFTYQMLNRALRTLQGDIITNMGFFIRDLHEKIQELYRKQVGSYSGNSFILYRGQGFLKTGFAKLLETSGGLMSFNNFLSTSKNRNVSLRFAKGA